MTRLENADVATKNGAQSYEFMIGNAETYEDLAVHLWREGELGASDGAETSHARYQWFYLRNPEGVARVNLLLHSAARTPIGFIGIGSRQLMLSEQKIAAGILVDFVVIPKHRSAFPALLLQRNARTSALEVMPILYGLPDTKALVISKRLGSQVWFDLPRFVRVIRGRTYFEKHMPRFFAVPLAFFSDTLDWLWMRLHLAFNSDVGQWIDQFNEEFDALWHALDKRDLCIGVRDQAFLKWRFTQQPGHQYRTFILKRKGVLLMYFVCEVTGETLSVRDCLNIGSTNDFKIGLIKLSAAARQMNIKAVEVQASLTSSLIRALRGAQFLLRSSRPFFAVVNESLRNQTNSVHWFVTPADEDV